MPKSAPVKRAPLHPPAPQPVDVAAEPRAPDHIAQLLRLQSIAGNRIAQRVLQTAPGRLQRQVHPAETAVRGGAGAALPDQAEYTRLIQESVRRTLTAFEHIEVVIPALDPRPPAAGHGHAGAPRSAGAAAAAAVSEALGGSVIGATLGALAGGAVNALTGTRVTVRTPYWISDRNPGRREPELARHGQEAMRRLFRTFPAGVRTGKSSPEEVRSATQSALDHGLIRGAHDAWPPTAADVAAWMRRVGVGVDCSGFIYQALTEANQALQARGAAGMLVPFTQDIINTGSGSLYNRRQAAAAPSELRVGDVMYLRPTDDAVGHVRLITNVTGGEAGLEFETAESAGSAYGPDQVDGPHGARWRFPDAARFAGLQAYRYVSARAADHGHAAQPAGWYWQAAGSRDQTAQFSHTFAAAPQAARRSGSAP